MVDRLAQTSLVAAQQGAAALRTNPPPLVGATADRSTAKAEPQRDTLVAKPTLDRAALDTALAEGRALRKAGKRDEAEQVFAKIVAAGGATLAGPVQNAAFNLAFIQYERGNERLAAAKQQPANAKALLAQAATDLDAAANTFKRLGESRDPAFGQDPEVHVMHLRCRLDRLNATLNGAPIGIVDVGVDAFAGRVSVTAAPIVGAGEAAAALHTANQLATAQKRDDLASELSARRSQLATDLRSALRVVAFGSVGALHPPADPAGSLGVDVREATEMRSLGDLATFNAKLDAEAARRSPRPAPESYRITPERWVAMWTNWLDAHLAALGDKPDVTIRAFAQSAKEALGTRYTQAVLPSR